ncbi:MAG: histidinol-phosphatase HisJ [Sulfurimonas sp.]|nr:histidinol-phosphatase HisJ [Sulfurimonas sp.]
MKVDLHNHTTLCNHATGTIDKYIQKAIKNGVKYYGFSDHAPMDFEPQYRMNFEQMKEYEDDIKQAKKRYKNECEILLGYEVDYLKGHIDERVLNADVDYLIGSVHFIDKWGFDNPEFIGKYAYKDIDEIWQEYFDTIEEMASTKLFDIVGHIDLIKIFKFMPKKDISLLAAKALKAIKKAGMVMELNSAGFRKPIGEAYPSLDILKEAYKLGIEITFGSDAHALEQVCQNYDKILNMAKNVGYTKCVIFKKRKKVFIDI